MDGLADMGGTLGWGPVHPPRRDEPVFEEPWQRKAFALAILSSRVACGGINTDAFRHALERLDRAAYLDDGYYGRWLNAGELMLTDSAILAPGTIDARARNLRGEHVEEPPIPEPARPDYTPTAEGSLRAAARPLVDGTKRPDGTLVCSCAVPLDQHDNRAGLAQLIPRQAARLRPAARTVSRRVRSPPRAAGANARRRRPRAAESNG